VNGDVGALTWRRAVAIVTLLLVWMVFIAALATIGGYIWSEFVDSPPPRDPAPVGAATAPSAASRQV
jgi:hypothetical protein